MTLAGVLGGSVSEQVCPEAGEKNDGPTILSRGEKGRRVQELSGEGRWKGSQGTSQQHNKESLIIGQSETTRGRRIQQRDKSKKPLLTTKYSFQMKSFC